MVLKKTLKMVLSWNIPIKLSCLNFWKTFPLRIRVKTTSKHLWAWDYQDHQIYLTNLCQDNTNSYQITKFLDLKTSLSKSSFDLTGLSQVFKSFKTPCFIKLTRKMNQSFLKECFSSLSKAKGQIIHHLMML